MPKKFLNQEEIVMNKVILMGRLTKDPEVHYSRENEPVARYTLAVDRRVRREGEQNADFINCVTFGRLAEVAEKYFRKGTKIAITGRIQTGSYTNKDGQKVYTTTVVVEEREFAESKAAGNTSATSGSSNAFPQTGDGFMEIPDDEELPFN